MTPRRKAWLLVAVLGVAGVGLATNWHADIWFHIVYAKHGTLHGDKKAWCSQWCDHHFSWYERRWGKARGIVVQDHLCHDCRVGNLIREQGPKELMRNADLCHSRCPTFHPRNRGVNSWTLPDGRWLSLRFSPDGSFETILAPGSTSGAPLLDSAGALVAPPNTWRCTCTHASHQDE